MKIKGTLGHHLFLRFGGVAALVATCVTPFAQTFDANSETTGPKPPANIRSLAYPATEDGFADQGSEEANRPLFDDLSWRMFVAMNWPSKSTCRGTPNTQRKFGDTSLPTVWETFKDDAETVPPDGSDPLPWECNDSNAPGTKIMQGQQSNTKRLFNFSKFSYFNQAGPGVLEAPLIDQNSKFVRYELRINRTEFDFIRDNQYYKRSVLEPITTKIEFPDQSIEVKAAWKELPKSDYRNWRKFYHKPADVAVWDENDNMTFIRVEVGLVGLHIITKTPQRQKWVWATFEHVDNTTGDHPSFSSVPDLPYPPAPIRPINWQTIKPGKPPTPAPVEVSRFDKEPSATLAINTAYRQHPQIKNTVWANYRLVRTQWPKDDDFGTPQPATNVANITMETYKQGASCMQCHSTTKKCKFVYFLEQRVLSPDVAKKNLESVFRELSDDGNLDAIHGIK